MPVFSLFGYFIYAMKINCLHAITFSDHHLCRIFRYAYIALWRSDAAEITHESVMGN